MIRNTKKHATYCFIGRLLLYIVTFKLPGLTMPNLRNKVSKRKSDSFALDNSKVQNTSAGTVLRRNVQVPIAAQL